MKNINKLILPVMLLTPFLITSCGDDTKVSGLTIDAQEMVYAYSQTCSTSLTITSSDVEFIDDFKGEYFTFDNADDIKGKSYVINKTSSKTIVITFTGAYTGTDLTKDNGKEITYKINKSAFKNNKVTSDATGKMKMIWDYSRYCGGSTDLDFFAVECNFTSSSAASTRIELKSSIVTQEYDLNDYSSISSSAKIKFSREETANDTRLRIEISGLSSDQQSAFPIIISNKSGRELFENLPENYGLSFNILKDSAGGCYYLADPLHLYFDKTA